MARVAGIARLVGLQRRYRFFADSQGGIDRWCPDLEEISQIVYFRGLIQRDFGIPVASFFVGGLGSCCPGLLPRNAAVDGIDSWQARFEF